VSTRFFITGAQGFVGRYVTAHLLAERPDAEVFGIGRSPELRETFAHTIGWAGVRVPGPLPADLESAPHHSAYRYASIDLNARLPLIRALAAFRPHVVIHLASALRDDPPGDLVRINVEGTGTLIESIAEAGVDLRRLVVCSSGGVYGSGVPPFDEETACWPVDLYSVSKLTAEDLARALAARRGIATIVARLFNVVGAGEDDRHAGPQFARQTAEIHHGLRARVVDVGDLSATRDLIDVRDVAAALATLADRGAAGGVYNVATGVESSMRSLLDSVLGAAGLSGAVEIRQRPVGSSGLPHHFADVSRLRALGWAPHFELARSAWDMVEYYRVRVAEAARGAGYGAGDGRASMTLPPARSAAMRSRR
jgi:nucleoside-diphosphate-sugar epimerase